MAVCTFFKSSSKRFLYNGLPIIFIKTVDTALDVDMVYYLKNAINTYIRVYLYHTTILYVVSKAIASPFFKYLCVFYIFVASYKKTPIFITALVTTYS